MTNKVTFSITFHEGKGDRCGNYETLENLNAALRKLGKQYAEGYTKTDVNVFLSGVLLWKGQIEPDITGTDTDLLVTLDRWIAWYGSESCENFIGAKAKEHQKFFSWLRTTIDLFAVHN